MTDLPACRSAFEKWACGPGNLNLEINVPKDRYFFTTTYCAWEAWQAAWNTRTPESGEAVADDPKTDREVLVYLMDGFDTQSWECPSCGHGEDCATMDSAFFLRDYLRTHPPTPSVDVETLKAMVERWRASSILEEPSNYSDGFYDARQADIAELDAAIKRGERENG